MAEAAVKLEERPGVELPAVRRFELPDLSQHGGWIVKRMLNVYKHLSEQQLAGWLRGIINSNEFLFLYQPHSVALFQAERGQTLKPRPIVREHFVWALNTSDPAHIKEAGWFYDRARDWANFQNADTIILLQQSDVPAEVLKTKFDRLFSKTEHFARL